MVPLVPASLNGPAPASSVTAPQAMGVPLPSAWLGGLKGKDLVAWYGGQDGFWRQFAAGIEQLRVEDGQLTVQLAP